MEVNHHVLQSVVTVWRQSVQQLFQALNDSLHYPIIIFSVWPLSQMLDLLSHGDEVIVQVKGQQWFGKLWEVN